MNCLDDFSKSVCITLLSSFLTFVFAIVLFVLQSWWTRRKQRQRERQILAKALSAEIEVLILFYTKMKLSSNPPEKGEELKIAYISQNYIAVYENQVDKIGIFAGKDVGAIIAFYTLIKALMDSLVYLSHRWELYAQYTRTALPNPNEIEMKYKDMLNAHKAVFDYQEKIYELYPDVLTRLKKYDFPKED